MIVVLLAAAALVVLTVAWHRALRDPRGDARVIATTEWHRVGAPAWDDAWHTAYGPGVQAKRFEDRLGVLERQVHRHLGIRKLP